MPIKIQVFLYVTLFLLVALLSFIANFVVILHLHLNVTPCQIELDVMDLLIKADTTTPLLDH